MDWRIILAELLGLIIFTVFYGALETLVEGFFELISIIKGIFTENFITGLLYFIEK